MKAVCSKGEIYLYYYKIFEKNEHESLEIVHYHVRLFIENLVEKLVVAKP